MIKEITTKRYNDFKSEVRNHTIQEGDRIYIDGQPQIKRRQIDKWLKTAFKDVKRVSCITRANRVYSDSDGNVWTFKKTKYMTHNGWMEKITYINDYLVIKPYIQYLKSIYPNDNFSEDWRYIDPDQFAEKYPGTIIVESYMEGFPNLMEDVNDIRVYRSHSLVKEHDAYLNQFIRVSSEDVSFESIEMLLVSSDKANVKLALTMMESLNVEQFFSELLCIFFLKTKHRNLIRDGLLKYPIFKECQLPGLNQRSSNLSIGGFPEFVRIITELKKNNIFINNDYVLKFLLHERQMR